MFRIWYSTSSLLACQNAKMPTRFHRYTEIMYKRKFVRKFASFRYSPNLFQLNLIILSKHRRQ